MKSCLFLAFFLLQLLSFKPVSSSVLTDVCAAIGDSNAYTPCVNMIGADPRSNDVKNSYDVALIAADISINKAVEYQTYAKELADNSNDADDAKAKAEAADGIFADAIKNLEFVKQSLLSQSHTGVTAAADAAKNAEQSASQLIDLAKFNHDYENISYVLWSLVLD